MVWGRLGQDSKPKPDEGGVHGCLGAGAALRACGWVTPYNYTTVVKAPEPRVAVAVVGRRGMPNLPSARPRLALNGLVYLGWS